MDQLTLRGRNSLLRIAVVTLLFLSAQSAISAGSDTWTGTSNANWSIGGNWTGTNTPPMSNDSLTFTSATGAGGLNLNNDLTTSSFNIAGITYDPGAAAFVIGDGTTNANAGNPFVLTGAVTNNSTSLETINDPFSMTAVQTFTTSSGDILLGGNISGSGGGIDKEGAGTLTLSGNNTYTGLTSVGGGELDLNSTGGQSIAGNVTVSGGTAKLLKNDQIATGSTLTVSGGTFDLAGKSQSLTNISLTSGNISTSVSGGVLTGLTNNFDMQNGTASAALAGSVGLNKTTSGTVILSGANTYTGATTVNAGTLQAGVMTNAFGANSAVSVAAGATLDLNSYDNTLGSLADVVLGAGGTVKLGTATLTVGTDNTNTTFSGVIEDGSASGQGYLTKVGTGTLTLSGNSTYTGDTEVDAGTLKVTGSISNGFNVFVGTISGSGTLSVSGGAISTNNNTTIGDNSGANTGTVIIDGATSSWTSSGSLRVGDGETGTGFLIIKDGGSASNSDGLVGTGGSLSTSAAGTVTVDGANSTWTNTRSLIVGDSGAGTVNITNGGVVNVSNSGGNPFAATLGNSAIGSGTVLVDGAGSQFNVNGQLSVANGGSGLLTITNGGVVGPPSIPGSTLNTVISQNGIVIDDSSLLSPGGVAVGTGGLLKGLGTVTGDVTNDGTVSPGHDAALGTLHLTGNYVQNSGGTLNIAIGSLSYFDNLAVTGNATLDGTLNVTLAGYTGNAGDVFKILSSAGLTGNFSTIVLPSLSPGLYFTESTDLDNVYLTVNASLSGVPEPSTWFAGFLAAATLGVSLWRRRAPQL